MMATTTTVSPQGDITLPAELRRQFGLEAGAPVIAEACADGILIRRAPVEPPIEAEAYTPERQAEFLLSNAVDAADYARALSEVRRLGLDPATIPHYLS